MPGSRSALLCLIPAAARGIELRSASEPVGVASSAACRPFLSTFDDESPLNVTAEYLGEDGGAWSPCTHLKTYGLNFAPFLGRFLSYQLKPESALEFGCGLGTMSDFVARNSGASVTCIEPEKTLGTLISSLRRDNKGNGKLSQLALNVFDTDKKSASCTSEVAAMKHDLVFSLEVAEHIPAQFRPALVDFLAKSTKKWLVFSAARPGQGGTGHIDASMLTREQWQEIFEKKGLVYMPFLTDVARESARGTRSYDLKHNMLVFKHPSNPAPDTSVPHEMLMDFMYGGLDKERSEAQFKWEKKAEAATAFAEGNNAAVWPSLSLLEQKAKKGIACSPGSGSSGQPMLIKASPGAGAEPPAMESAYAAHFFSHRA